MKRHLASGRREVLPVRGVLAGAAEGNIQAFQVRGEGCCLFENLL